MFLVMGYDTALNVMLMTRKEFTNLEEAIKYKNECHISYMAFIVKKV